MKQTTAERGEAIIKFLGLKQVRDDNGKKYIPARYYTSWGTKTAEGLASSLDRLLTQEVQS